MLPYLSILLISFILPHIVYRPAAFASEEGYSEYVYKKSKMTVVMFFFGLLVLLALRDITVGNDLYAYETIFNSCIGTSFKHLPDLQWELGYTIYNKLISLFSKDYRIFLMITAIITLFPIYKLYSQEKKYGFLAIVLFINMPCFLMVFSGLKQAIATSIGILAYLAIKNKKYILSALLILSCNRQSRRFTRLSLPGICMRSLLNIL